MIVSLKINPNHSTDTIPNARPRATLVKEDTISIISTYRHIVHFEFNKEIPHTLQVKLVTGTLLLRQHQRFVQAPFDRTADRQQ
jgi:hypothetical protein